MVEYWVGGNMYILLTVAIALVAFYIGRSMPSRSSYQAGYLTAWDDMEHVSKLIQAGSSLEEAIAEMEQHVKKAANSK